MEDGRSIGFGLAVCARDMPANTSRQRSNAISSPLAKMTRSFLAAWAPVPLTGQSSRILPCAAVGKNVEACLRVAGASLSDIIETRTYVADPDQLAKYADLRKQYFGSAAPARTIVQKGGLSDPNNLVEVMAFAGIR